MKSHATNPIPFKLDQDRYRIYFSARDSQQRNQLGSLEINLNNPLEYVNLSSRPHFSFGEDGHFDCDGVYGSSLVKRDNDLLLYYSGWNAGKRGLFYSSIGAACSTDGGRTFSRLGKSPILQRDEIDPWAVMAPFVLKEGPSWMMWYASGMKIVSDGVKISSSYDVKTAVSKNGTTWRKTGKTAIDLGRKDSNIARACVIKGSNNLYKAWYPYLSKRRKQYRIGYAESDDGFAFIRKDDSPEASLRVSRNKTDWDSLALSYPYAFEHNDELHLIYNGNDFGKTGFGIAKWI